MLVILSPVAKRKISHTTAEVLVRSCLYQVDAMSNDFTGIGDHVDIFVTIHFYVREPESLTEVLLVVVNNLSL